MLVHLGVKGRAKKGFDTHPNLLRSPREVRSDRVTKPHSGRQKPMKVLGANVKGCPFGAPVGMGREGAGARPALTRYAPYYGGH